TVQLTPHEFHGNWNYTIKPRKRTKLELFRLSMREPLVTEKWKQFAELSAVRPASILANLERFGELHLGRLLLAVPLTQLGPKPLGMPLSTRCMSFTDQLAPCFLLGRFLRQQVGRTECPTLVELRFQGFQGGELLLHHGIDCHHDIRLKRVGLLE